MVTERHARGIRSQEGSGTIILQILYDRIQLTRNSRDTTRSAVEDAELPSHNLA